MQDITCSHDIFSGYEKKVLIGLLLTLITSLNTFSQSGSVEETSDIIIHGDVRVYIDSSEQVITHGSLTGIDGARLENQGALVFDINGMDQSIVNYSSPDLFYGLGSYYFKGNGSMSVGGDFENAFYNLWINKTEGAAVYLNRDMWVNGSIVLGSGLVDTGADNFVIVSNSDSGAIVMDDYADAYNTSYIFGNLRRYVIANSGYHFPVGAENLYFPLSLDNHFQGNKYLDVTFKDDVPLTGNVDFQLALYNFRYLNQTGAWKINSDIDPVQGSMDLSPYIFNFPEKIHSELEKNMFGLVYHGDPKGYSDEWTLEGEYERPGTASRLPDTEQTKLLNAKQMGYYTLAFADVTKLINFIAPGGGRETRFIIPSLENYESTELIVYNSMGRLIYESKPYENDLDMVDYKDGTYYYIFKFTKRGKPGVIQSFIDVKRIN